MMLGTKMRAYSNGDVEETGTQNTTNTSTNG